MSKRILIKINHSSKLSLLFCTFCFLVVSVFILSKVDSVVKAASEGETPYSTTGLVAQWNFNETSGTTANNNAGAGTCGGTAADCNGTLNGFDSTASQDQALRSGWSAINKVWGNGALMFDGSDDYVSIPNNSSLELTSAGTIEMWAYKNSNKNYQMYLTKWNESAATEYQIMGNESSGKIAVRWGSDDNALVTNGVIPLREWTFIVATYNGSFLKIYINGQLENSVAWTTDAVANGSDVLIGARDGGYNFDGKIDSTRIYNRALTPEEILSNYQSYTPTNLDTVFTDNFSGGSIGDSWNTVAGNWTQGSGFLSSNSGTGFDDQKAIVDGIEKWTDYTITAKVRVDSWVDSKDAPRAGVSVLTNTSDQNGYTLVFNQNHNTVGWLDDQTEWGPSYTFNWSNDVWYWFKVEYQNGVLYGKVWADGSPEPTSWPYTWARSGRAGYPALNGGSNHDGFYSTASFDDVSITKNSADNIAQAGSGRYAIDTFDQLGGALGIMTNGSYSDSDQSQQDPPVTKSPDYWGVGFDEAYTYNRVVFTTGQYFGDGGWFVSGLKVQVKQSGDWVDVSDMVISPTPAYNNSDPFTSYTFTFDSISGDAIRVSGVPVQVEGHDFQFTSVSEFEVYNDSGTSQVPANDLKINATTIHVDDSLVVDNTYATTETEGYANEINHSVWYKFNPPENISYTVDLCDSAIAYTKLFIFEQLPGQESDYLDLHRIADDGMSSGICTTQSAIPFLADSTKTYYFEVGTNDVNPFGEITVHLSETIIPAPDYGSSINIPSSYVNIGMPEGMVTLPDGNIWYVDNMNYRLVKFNPTTNTILRTVGRLGSAEGEFSYYIIDITRDNDGYLYVLTTDSYVYKLDSNGGFMAKYDLRDLPNDMGLHDPFGLTYDSYTDTILIANRLGYKIEKFTKNLVFINSFGEQGTGNGQFGIAWQQEGDRENGPTAVATDADGRIYVSDEYNARVQVFNSNYSFIREIKGPWTKIEDGNGDGTTEFSSPRGIIVLSDGTITVCNNNWQYSTVEQFSSNGTHIGSFGGYGLDVSNMKAPKFIVKDNADNIYVSDTGDIGIKAITKYTSSGEYVSTLRNNYFSDGKFYNPISPIYDSEGNMYIMDGDVNTRRVQKFSSGGSYIHTVIPTGVIDGAAYNAIFGQDNKMYISSRNGIQVFDKVSDISWVEDEAAYIGLGHGSGDGQFMDAAGMAFDAAGNMFVADAQNHRIQKLVVDENGHYVYDAENGSTQFGGGWDGSDQNPPEPNELATPVSIVFDSTYQNLFITDHRSFKKFSLVEGVWTYVEDFGVAPTNYEMPDGLGIDSNDNLYLSDIWGKKILVYDSSSGEIIDTFGRYGGGQMQFENAGKVTFNPDGVMVVGDSNGRIQAATVGYRILNLIPSANVIRLDSGHVGESLSEQTWVPTQQDPLTAVPARLMFGDYAVADFTVNLTEDRDWSDVNVLTLPLNSKSLVVNLNPTLAPGLSATHSLYISRYANQTSVTVCPQATTLAQVASNCTNAYALVSGVDSDLSASTISGKSYWKIDNLEGTGAFSSLFTTTYDLRDQMSRLQINVGSNHRIEFGTSYDLTHSGDTIKITFASGWDLTDLTIGDLSLIDDNGTPLTLSADGPDLDTWGVTWEDNQLIFTAPESGVLEYIAANSNIVLIINNTKIINPSTPDSYNIDIRMDSDVSGVPYVEVGSIGIPIVDSDTVDIKGYVNAYLHFDIDTGTGEEPSLSVTPIDCGFSDCLAHENGSTADNYTIDLGELKSTYINKSQEVQMHSDGTSGAINSIYFDLTTNAQTGAVITVSSANEGLQGPVSKIASVTDGEDITTNSGLYGFNLPVASARLHGTIVPNSLCSESNKYCSPGSISTPQEVFNTNELPVDGARVRMDLAAAAAYTDTPGSYTDTLTFVALATF